MKMKRVLMIVPHAKEGSPAAERCDFFERLFCSLEASVERIPSPKSMGSFLRAAIRLWTGRYDAVFITMPPFSTWLLLLLPGVKFIVDWRDGWSIAMRRGYGGTAPKRHWKSVVARGMEVYAIARCKMVVTCTPGLLKYHKNTVSWLARKIAFIPNGFSFGREFYNFNPEINNKSNLSDLRVVCAGKFSEYGRDNAKAIIHALGERYRGRGIVLMIVGCERGENEWLSTYCAAEYPDFSIELLPRRSYREVLRLIASCDLGVALVRDPDYEIGTKVYDYIGCGIPILNYFVNGNQFTEYFSGFLDQDNGSFGSASIRDWDGVKRFSRDEIAGSAKEIVRRVI